MSLFNYLYQKDNSVKPEYAKIFAHARKLHDESRALDKKNGK